MDETGKYAEPWAYMVIAAGFVLTVVLGFGFQSFLAAIPAGATAIFAYVYRNPVQKAEAAAVKAELEYRERLAKQDIPFGPTAAQIALLKAEAEIKLWAERGNAEKVLEFTKKKHDLEKEIGRVQ